MKKIMQTKSDFGGVSSLPSFTLSEDSLPSLKDAKVGDEMELCIKVKVAHVQQGSAWDSADKNAVKPLEAKLEVSEVEDCQMDEAGMKPGETFGQAYGRKRSAGHAAKEDKMAGGMM